VRRSAFIKRHAGKSVERAVVRLGLCLGSHYMEEEVSLVAREKFSHQMLVGRSFLAGNVLVDSAVNYTVEPNCQGAPQS
jgi:hypothetical protein